MIVKKAEFEDAAVISEMIFSEFPYTKADAENVKLRMSKPQISLFKAVDGARIAGFLELELLDSLFGIWRINGLAVRKEFRQNGIGKELAEFAVSFAKRGRASQLVLLVRPDNYIAKKMYRKIGFQANGLWKSQINGKRAEEWVLNLQNNFIV